MNGEEFLKRISAGDATVWDDLAPMLNKIVIGVCHAYRIDDEERKDIGQDVATKVFMHWQSYKGQSALSTWLYSIARRRCIDVWRKRKARGEVRHKNMNSPDDLSADPIPDSGYDPKFDLELCVQELMDELESEVHARRGSRRKIDVLKFWVQHSPTMDELAEFLDTTVGAAKQRMYEIRKHVEGLCRKHCGHDDCSLHITGGRS